METKKPLTHISPKDKQRVIAHVIERFNFENASRLLKAAFGFSPDIDTLKQQGTDMLTAAIDAAETGKAPVIPIDHGLRAVIFVENDKIHTIELVLSLVSHGVVLKWTDNDIIPLPDDGWV